MNRAGRRRRQPFPGAPAASLSDVAERAKVSSATVSRVLTGRAPVSVEMKARVERACAELGYVPNGAARALSSRRTMTIGAIVPTIENDAFARAISALHKSLDAAGYTLLLASSDYEPKTELRQARMLLSHGVDGLVLVGCDHDPELMPLIERKSVPAIETWTLSPDRACVGFDNADAARQVAEYLISLGHERIGVIAGRTRNNDRAAARVEGVRRCLRRHGLRLESQWLIERPYRILEGQQAMQSLMTGSTRPTAVICGNDQLALGALIGASMSGLSIPRDVSVVGFNDLDYSAYLNPPLTTMKVPVDEIGRAAGAFLLASLAGEAVLKVSEIPVSLVVRSSTAPPAKSRVR